jgi:Fic family protein
MDIAAFSSTPMGDLAPIRGYDYFLKREYDHFAFVPKALPTSFDLQQRTYKTVSEAERALGRLDSAMRQVPDPSILVRPSLYREAVSTSALEGTFAPLTEVIEADYTDEAQRSYEVREILNAVRAAEQAIELLKERPICVTVLDRLQQTLVRGTRSDGADAGRLRTGTVYIGERTNGIERSRFVPPPAGAALVRGMDDWEKWVNADDDIPLLIKIAMGHYQFETLHPYTDGNGRLGRLVMLLQLMEAKALTYPVLDLSTWLEPKKDEYKDHLLRLSRTGEIDPLVHFMATGLAASSVAALTRIERLMATRAAMVRQLKEDGARGVVLELVDDLMRHPFITASQAAAQHGVTYPPASNAIQRMLRLGILDQWGERKYGRVYICWSFLNAVNAPMGEEA